MLCLKKLPVLGAGGIDSVVEVLVVVVDLPVAGGMVVVDGSEVTLNEPDVVGVVKVMVVNRLVGGSEELVTGGVSGGWVVSTGGVFEVWKVGGTTRVLEDLMIEEVTVAVTGTVVVLVPGVFGGPLGGVPEAQLETVTVTKTVETDIVSVVLFKSV